MRKGPMTEAEREAIAASVRWAKANLAGNRMGMDWIARQPIDELPLPDYEAECLFAQLRYKPNRTLRTAHARQTIQTAVDRNDFKFFIKLGHELKQPAITPEHLKADLKLPIFLLDHWLELRDGLPELCRLTPEGLVDVCRHKLKRDSLEAAAVTKLRQRLRLVSFKRDKIHVVMKNGSLRFTVGKNGPELAFS